MGYWLTSVLVEIASYLITSGDTNSGKKVL